MEWHIQCVRSREVAKEGRMPCERILTFETISQYMHPQIMYHLDPYISFQKFSFRYNCISCTCLKNGKDFFSEVNNCK